jgi:hypothetical protein
MKIVALLFGALLVSDGLACVLPPPEQYVPSKELIKRTRHIVLAEVTKAEVVGDDEVLYTFKRIEVLSGAVADTFQFRGRPAIWGGDTDNFDHHFDPSFWKNNRGRTPNYEDCLIHPGFSVGGTYLLFIDKPYHVKSFELIIRIYGDNSTKDKWLQYVQANVRR